MTYPVEDILELARQQARWRAPRDLHNRDFAFDEEDLAQEAAIKVAAMNLPTNTHRGLVRRIVDRRVLDHVRFLGGCEVRKLNRAGNRRTRTGTVFEAASHALAAKPSSDPAWLAMMHEQVSIAYECLTGREREVLEATIGGLSQSAVGQDMGLSQARVGQIVRSAVKYAGLALMARNRRRPH